MNEVGVPLEGLHPALRALRTCFPDRVDEIREPRWVEFYDSEFPDAVYVRANVDEPTGRVRIRLFLAAEDPTVVERWVNAQPQPHSGVIEWAEEDDAFYPRLVFMRSADTSDWVADAMWNDLYRFKTAWINDRSVTTTDATPFVVENDPRSVDPENAWLLKGSEASWPDGEAIAEGRLADDRGVFSLLWTASRHTKPGDLALLYFIAPKKSVCFVARAASNAFFSSDIEVNATGPVADAQWWAYFTTPIAIHPITAGQLRTAADGHLVLRGRSGQYLRPETVQRLEIRALGEADAALVDAVCKVPTGNPNLPSPAKFVLERWRDVASGAVRNEDEVTRHLIRPLIEHVKPRSWSVREQYRAGRGVGVPDLVVLDGEEPTMVIEVKRALRRTRTGGLTDSPDLDQLRRYQRALTLPGILADASHLLLLDAEGVVVGQIERRSATPDDVNAVGVHMLGTR